MLAGLFYSCSVQGVTLDPYGITSDYGHTSWKELASMGSQQRSIQRLQCITAIMLVYLVYEKVQKYLEKQKHLEKESTAVSSPANKLEDNTPSQKCENY